MTANYAPLWYWVSEREAIRLKRAGGAPKPWTDDPILQTRRFCNVRREDDNVTVWIRENIRERFADHPHLWFMLCIGRWINRTSTLAYLIENNQWPSSEFFDPASMGSALSGRAALGEHVFTGGYTIYAGPRGCDKARNVAEVILGNVWRDRDSWASYFSGDALVGAPNLRKTHQRLTNYAGWGDFMAYQVVVDMRFTRLLRDCEDVGTWAVAGPGTMRGLNRLHGRPVKRKISQEQALSEMRAIFKAAEAETGVAIDFSDVPNILCECDKYLRVKRGEGDTRQRYPGTADD